MNLLLFNSFKDKTRMWKKVLFPTYAGIPQKSSYITVSGRIKEVVFTKNGVPFYGGPRFTIQWEDGTKDAELPAGELLRIYKETSESLGNSTILDHKVMDRLKKFGIQVGTFLETRKSEIFLKELRTKIKNQQVNIVGMVEMSLQAIPIILRGIKEISLIGFKGDTDEFKTLVNYTMVGEKKNKAPVQVQHEDAPQSTYKFSAIDVASSMITQGVDSLHTELDNHSTAWLGMELVVPTDFLWNKSVEYNRYLVIVHKSKIHEQEVTPFDVDIIQGVVLEIEHTVKTIWKVEQRRRQFRDFVRSLEAKLFEWRNSSINEMCYNLLSSIPKELFKAHMYVALLEPGADDLVYITANAGSRMEGRRLKRGTGVSFDVVDSSNTLIFSANDLDKRKLLFAGATVDVYYGKKLYKASIVKDRGHEMYDVRYVCDRKVEAGVDMSRIIPMNIAFRTKLFQNAKLPFVCVAIRHRSKVLGIMGVDHIEAECLIKEASIDGDLQMFLEQLGKLLGNAIDIRQKKLAIQALYVVSKNTHADVPDVINAFFDTIFRCSPFIGGIIVSELKAPDRPKVTNRSKFPWTPQANGNGNASNGNEKVLVVIGKRGEASNEVQKKLSNFDYTKFGKRPVQKIGNQGVFLFVNVTTADQESRLFTIALSYKSPISDPDYEFFETLQKTMAAVIQTILSQKASGEFRYEALKEMKELCHNHFVLNKRRHYNIFKVFRREFFHRLEDITLSCYHSTNMYVGILGKFASEMLYILATSHSNMVGKKLLRSENKGVSFVAVDEDHPVCVTASSLLSHKLKHFAEKHNFEYPFLVIPLIAGIDSVIGVLSADNCAGDQIAETADQLEDVISFFTTISIYIGNIIQQYRVVDVNEHLVNLASTVTSFAEGIPKLKTLLLSYLPFASRIVDITFRPQINYSCNYDSRDEPITAFTEKDLILLICVRDVKLYLAEDGSSNIFPHDKPKLKIYMNGHLQQEIPINLYPSSMMVTDYSEKSGKSSKSGKRDKDKTRGVNPIKVVISKNTNMEKLKVQFSITLNRDGFDKELVNKFLPFHYFLNCPLTLQEHYFDNSSSVNNPNGANSTNATDEANIPSSHHANQIRVGSMKLCSKVLVHNQVVGFHLSNLKAVLQTSVAADEIAVSATMELYVSIKWNGEFVGRTIGSSLASSTIQHSKSLEFDGLNSFLPINSFKNFDENRLVLEFFCNYDSNNPNVTMANKNREYFMSSVELTGEKLVRIFVAQQQLHHQPHHGQNPQGRIELPFVSLEIHGHGSECPKWITSLKCYLQGLVLPIQHSIIDPFCYLKLLKLNDEAMELQNIKPSKLIRIEKQKSTSKLVEEFVPCELRILRARDLFVPDHILKKLSTAAIASFDSVITISFNGEEVGSTSIARNSTTPEWLDESFRVMLPLSNPNSWKDELEGAVLLIEVFLVDDTVGMQYKLGSISIEGGDLGTIFLGKGQRMMWYDLDTDDNNHHHYLNASSPKSGTNNQSLPFIIENGGKRIISTQLLLSGKASSNNKSAVDSTHHVVDAVDNGFLEVSVCSLSDTLALTRSICHDASGTIFVTVSFNGKVVLETEEKEITAHLRKAVWSSRHTVAFRHPSPKTLYQSSLVFAVWHNILGVKTKICEFSYRNADLPKLLGKKGVVTRWCALPLLNALHENNLCDLEIQAGPYRARKIFEYDEFSLWLDLACCSQLSLTFKPPPRNDFRIDQRPNVFCLVYWNHEIVGRTEIEENVSNIVYERQRFILRVPVYYDESKRLNRCHLRIEIRHQPYDVAEHIPSPVLNENGNKLMSSKSILNSKSAKFEHATESSQLLGLVEMTGLELETFFRSDRQPELQWLALKQPGDIEAATKDKRGSNAVSIIRDENKSFIKLRGSYALSVSNMLVMSEDMDVSKSDAAENDHYTDYVLHILKATDLANTDAFGGANAYVEISWLDETIGYTQVIPDTLDEIFQHEQFILRWNKANKYETPNLLMQVWSISPGKPRTFLGRVLIGGKEIQELLSLSESEGTTEERVFKLERDPEMTEDENEMVRGKMTIEIEKIDYKEVLQGPKMLEESVLWIQSASNLPSMDSFNTAPSTYFTVIRSYEREGGEDIEIYRSTVCNNSFNPIYVREFVKVLVPNQSDWSGFSIMIQFHNALDQDVIARLQLKEERLKRILTRDSPSTVVEVRDYRLQVEEWILPTSRAATVESARIFIGGGLHSVFTTVERNIVLDQTKLLTGTMKKQLEEKAAVTKSPLEVLPEGDSDSDESKDNVTSMEGMDLIRRESMNNPTDKVSRKENEKMKFELVVESLSMQSTIPGQAFDGYIEIRWKHVKDITMKMSVMKLGFNGTKIDFDCERFIIEKGDGIHVTSCSLEFIIYQKFQMKESLPLAELMLLGDDLLSLLRRGPQKGKAVNWKFSVAKSATSGKTEAHLNLSLRVIPDFETSPLFNRKLNPPSVNPFMDLELTVVSAAGLAKAKMIGSSDPYAVVTYNFANLGQTATIYETLDPVWIDNQSFIFRFPKKYDAMLRMLTSSSITASRSASRNGSRVGSRQTRRRQSTFKMQEESDDVLFALDGIYSVEHLTIYVDFYSQGSMKPHTFLGCVELSGETIQELLSENYYYTKDKKWLPLVSTNRKKLADQKYVQGQVQLLLTKLYVPPMSVGILPRSGLNSRMSLNRGNPSQGGSNQPSNHNSNHNSNRNTMVLPEDAKEIDVMILGARDVLLESKAADTYVLVRWNGKIIGKTYIEKESTSPTWENEKFTIRIPANIMMSDCTLHLELWQSKSPQGQNNQDVLLGGTEMDGDTLEELIQGNNSPMGNGESNLNIKSKHQTTPGMRWIKLGKLDYLPEKVHHFSVIKMAQLPTALQIRCHYADQEKMIGGHVRRYEVKVFGAENIVNMETTFSSMDVFVIAKWDGREIGRTYKVTNSTFPVWKNQVFPLVFPIHFHNFHESKLTFEIWNQNRFTRNDFLGMVVITEDDLANIFEHHKVKKGIRRKYHLIGNHQNLKTNKNIEVRGLLDVGVKLLSEDKSLLKNDSDEESEDEEEEQMNIQVLEEEMKVTWFENVDQSSGKPFIELSVLSVQIVPVQAGSVGAKTGVGSSIASGPMTLSSLSQGGSSKLGFSLGGNASGGGSSKVGFSLGGAVANPGNNSSSSSGWLNRKPQKPGLSAGMKKILWKPSCTVSWNEEEVNHLPPIEINDVDWSGSWEVDLHQSNADGSVMLQKFTSFIPLPDNLYDLETSKLTFEIWDNDDFESDYGYLGGLMLPFPELLRLYCGRYTFFLLNNIDSDGHQVSSQPFHNHKINSDVWMGNITFALKFVFPFWDSSISLIPSKYTRRVHVLGASNLPLINGELPTTKCVLSINGVVVLKSIVITGQTHPSYPRIMKDILLDVNQPPLITIEIFHVNVKNRKEIKLGEESVPIEYLLRPPKQSIDLFIGPPKDESQRPKANEYSFALSGAIRVLVEGNNRLDDDYMPFLSPKHLIYDATRVEEFCNQFDEPIVNFAKSSTDFAWSHVASELLHIHENTTVADWLTNPISLGSVQEVASQPNWLILPIFDVGVTVGVNFSPFSQSVDQFALNNGTGVGGNYLKMRRSTSLDAHGSGPGMLLKPSAMLRSNSGLLGHGSNGVYGSGDMISTIGTKPGHRLVFAIERPIMNSAVSDKVLLEEVLLSLSSYFAKLRWKDINFKLREIAYNCLTVFVKESILTLKSIIKNNMAVIESGTEKGEEKEKLSYKDSIHHMLHFVRRCLELSFPGATIRFVNISEDYETLYYESFEGHAHLREHNEGGGTGVGGLTHHIHKRVIPSHFGDDQQYFGKQNHKSIAIQNFQDMSHSLSSAIDSNGLLLFQPFIQTYPQLPRFNAMFMSEDCSYGFFQIENFHFFQGGLPPKFDDPSFSAGGTNADVDGDMMGEDLLSSSDYSQSTTNSLGSIVPTFSANSQEFKDIRKWLESVGELCGTYIYAQLEARVMAALTEYLSHHTSHYYGLLAVILEQIVQVVRGCKLTEIITIDPTSISNDFKLTSVLHRQPLSSLQTTNMLYTHKVTLENIQIGIKRSHAEYEASEKLTIMSGGGGGLLEKVGGKQAWQGIKKIFSRSTDDHDIGGKGISFDDQPSGAINSRLELPVEASLDEDDPDNAFTRFGMQSKSTSSVKHRYISLHRLVLGIRYDEFEQVVPLKYNHSTDSLSVDRELPINVYLKANYASLASASGSLISMSIYEVDDFLHPVHENMGHIHNVSSLLSSTNTADTTISAKTILSPMTAKNEVYYDALYKLSLTSTEEQHDATIGTISTKKAAQDTGKSNVPPIKGFKLHLVKGNNLKTLKNNSPPSVFCEVSFQKKVIFTTKTVKGTTAPGFDEHIYIPYDAAAAAAMVNNGKNNPSNKGKGGSKHVNNVILELYDMTFLSKGNFFGRVELSFEQLLATLGQEATIKEYPLKMKSDMNPKKQGHVGGTLSFSIIADLTGSTGIAGQNGTTGDNLQSSLSGKNVNEVVDHWHRVQQMMNPQIKLTIESANDLMAANRFGGGSDPFVIIYFTYARKNDSLVKNAGGEGIASSFSSKISSKFGNGASQKLATQGGSSEDVEEPLGKTTVKEDTLHPIWNELFELPLLSSSNNSGGLLLGGKRDKLLSMEEMPIMRFELYDFNQFTSATFLGQCEIPANIYLNRNQITMELSDRGGGTGAPGTVGKKIAVANKSSLLSHLSQQKVKGNLNLRWEFVDLGNALSSSVSAALSREQRLLQWVWNPYGGLTRLDCIELKIVQIMDINRGKKSILSSSCNPYVVLKHVPRRKHSVHHHHHPASISEEGKDLDTSISIRGEQNDEGRASIEKKNFPDGTSGSGLQRAGSSSSSIGDIAAHALSPAESNAGGDAAEFSLLSGDASTLNVTGTATSPVGDSAIIGKTKRKKNTLSPVYNETFNINLSLKFPEEYPNILLEVWHKDDYFGTEEFLGEVVVVAEEYLHPRSSSTSGGSNNITLDLLPNRLKNPSKELELESVVGQIVVCCNHTKVVQGVPLTKHNYELFHRYNHSTGVELMAMEMIDSTKEELDQLHKKNPIYAQRMPLTMTYDPTLELERQKQEHTNLPVLLNRTNYQLDKYVKNPFTRTGLISELHYGQLCAASKRCEKTVLKTERSDMICIPLYTKKSSPSVATGTNATISSSTGGTQSDTATSNSNTVNVTAGVSHSNIKHQATYLVCRFPANRSSKRDVKFLEKLQSQVLSCHDTLSARERRKASLTQLLQNITLTSSMVGLSNNNAGDSSETNDNARKKGNNSSSVSNIGMGSTTSAVDVMIQAMLDFEVCLNCSARCYLLHDDGKTFHPVSMETGKIQPMSLNTQNAVQQHEFIQELASLLRYDIMIQYYQQRISICKCSWNSLKFSQVDLPEVIELYDEIECYLGVKELKMYKKVFKHLKELYFNEGCFVIPIFSFQEVMVGMIILKNINQNPYALYEFYEEDDSKAVVTSSGGASGGVGQNAGPGGISIASKSSSLLVGGGPVPTDVSGGMSSASLVTGTTSKAVDKEFDYNEELDDDEAKTGKKKRKVKTIKGMEYGISQILLKSSMMFSDVFLTAKLNNSYRSIRSFPLKEDTSPLMVIRYAFRMLITAVPAIREISLWAVHLPNAKQLLTANHAQEMMEAMKKKENEKEQEDEVDGKPEVELGSSKKAPPSLAVIQKQGSMLQRMLSFSSKNTGGAGGPGAVSGMASFLRQSFRGAPATSAKNSSTTQPSTKVSPSADASMKSNKGVMLKHSDIPKDHRIIGGVFGTEDPNLLMHSPMERKTPGNLSGATPLGAFGARRLNNALSKKDEELKLQEQKAEEAASWKVHLPTALDSRKRRDAHSTHAPSRTIQTFSLDLAYHEIIRCVEELQQRTFHLHTGHCLSQIGGNDMDTTTRDLIMSTLFNQVYIFANKQRASMAVASASTSSKVSAPQGPIAGSVSASGSSRPMRAPLPQGPPPESSKTTSSHPNPNMLARRKNIAAASSSEPSSSRGGTQATAAAAAAANAPKPFVRRHGNLLPRPTNSAGSSSHSLVSSATPPVGRNRRSAMVTDTKNLEQKKTYFFLSVNTHGIDNIFYLLNLLNFLFLFSP